MSEEAIDEATCVETVYDAGIKIEKNGIDWSRLQILRKETQDEATGEISVASSAPPTLPLVAIGWLRRCLGAQEEEEEEEARARV